MQIPRLIAISLVLETSIGFSAGSNELKVSATYCLPATALSVMGEQPFSPSEQERARTNGLNIDDLPSIGSGLARAGNGEFFGISDRGPNGEVAGKRTFPLPEFSPFITRFKLQDGVIKISNVLLLTDSKGKPLSGLSNQVGEERLFEFAGANKPLPFDPNGVDPEAIRVFPDGKFLISEEYGPSILVVNTNGAVLMRYVPENKPLPGTTYPVTEILPAVLSHRRTNRGFEALVLSPDGRTAFAMLQSPLGDEVDKKFNKARVSRVVRLDLSDPTNARLTGEFLMPLSKASEYSATQKQSGVKLNDAEWLGRDKLLVLEHAGDKARLVVADFTKATNLQNHPEATPALVEGAGEDLQKNPFTPAATELFATISGFALPDTKIEGLSILSPTEIAISNDNDFGIGSKNAETNSFVWIFKLSQPLPLSK